MQIIILNGKETEAFFAELNVALDAQRPTLFRALGDALTDNVKQRIRSSDGGKWAHASKWLRAKSGQSKVLRGAEKYVRFTVTRDMLNIVGHTGKWSLTQHHEGFVNELFDESEVMDQNGKVVLKIKDPRPLALYAEYRNRPARGSAGISRYIRSREFRFIPHRAGKTPARKIWPTTPEAQAISEPIGFKWLEKIVRETGGALVK